MYPINFKRYKMIASDNTIPSSVQVPPKIKSESERQPGVDRMEESETKVVNEEEQNRAVNTNDQDMATAEPETTTQTVSPPAQSPNEAVGSVIDKPNAFEGDNTMNPDRKSPNL